MNASPIHGITYIATGVLLWVVAVFLFYIAKGGAKQFLRVLVEESPTVEEDYRMLRGLLTLLVAGTFFMVVTIWGAARLLNVDEWMHVFGS